MLPHSSPAGCDGIMSDASIAFPLLRIGRLELGRELRGGERNAEFIAASRSAGRRVAAPRAVGLCAVVRLGVLGPAELEGDHDF